MKHPCSLLKGCGVAVLFAVALISSGILLSGCASSHPSAGAESPASAAPVAENGGTQVLPPMEHPGKNGFLSNLGLLEALTRDAAREAVDSLPLAPGAPVTVLSTSWHEANWFVGDLVAQALAASGHKVKVVEYATKPADTAAPAQPGNGQGQDQNQAPAGGDQTGGANGGHRKHRAGGQGAGSDTTGAKSDTTKTEQKDPLWQDQNKSNDQTPNPAPGAGAGAAAAPEEAKPATPLPTGDILDVRVLEFGVGYSDVSRSWLFGPVRFTRIGGVYLQVSHLTGPDGDLQKVSTAERHQVDHLGGEQRSLAEGASYPFTPPDLKLPSMSRYIEPTVVVAIVASLVYLFQKNQN